MSQRQGCMQYQDLEHSSTDLYYLSLKSGIIQVAKTWFLPRVVTAEWMKYAIERIPGNTAVPLKSNWVT